MQSPKPDLTGSARIKINGNTGWLLGANLPWIKCGGDFGENIWGAYGIGSADPPSEQEPLSSQVLRTTFQAMQAAGVNVARWFLFFDGRAGITYDGASGSPTGLDAVILRDLDAAVSIAKVYGIRILLVLISFEWMFNKLRPDDITGGRSNILKSAAMQDALINNVFVPVFQRYADDDSVLAYDVANEPEWGLTGGNLPGPAAIDRRSFDPVSLDDFTGFATKVAAAAQQYAPAQYVTLGSARAKWVGCWQNVGLDFFQFHYYPQTETPKTLIEVLPDLPPGLDRPIWLGEFPANLSGSLDFMGATLEGAYNSGSQGGMKLAGAAPWPMRDVGDGYGAADAVVLKQFFDAHSGDINSGVPPVNTGTQQSLD
jgi:hypothetical protein